MINKLLKLFKNNSFTGDFYGWITNQISHVSFSFVLCYGLGFFVDNYIVAYVFASLWFIWEIVHLYKSKDLNDFIQDLFFELGGIAVFLTDYYLIAVILVFIFAIINELKKD